MCNPEGGLHAALRRVFETAGYRRYKMSKFEEYDLYSRNRSFLQSEKVLTFTDTDGKLLALKPDVTLSIIKNFRGSQGLEKLYYHENVYRASGVGFREIEQAGLECIGDVDEYSVCEVLSLAAKSLMTVGRDAELDVSHLGLLCDLLDGFGDDLKSRVLRFFGGKNTGELRSLLESSGVPDEAALRIIELSDIDCPADEAPEKLQDILGGYVSWERLQLFCDTCRFLGDEFPGMIRVDFSTVGDLSYYSGIIFRGFIDGVPESVLSGGQYDNLAEKLSKHARAIGFALYLDLIDPLLLHKTEYDCDTLLLYSEDKEPQEIYHEVKNLQEKGLSVMTAREVPAGLKFREIYSLKEGGSVRVE